MKVDLAAEGCVCVTNGTAGAASRKQIAVGKCDPAAWDGHVQLFWAGGGGVKVYTDASNGVEVTSGATFANTALPTNLWGEGTAPSAAVGDVVFRLNPVEAVCPNAAEGCDRGTMTVVRVDVDVDGLAESEEETVPGGVVCVTNGPNHAVSRRRVTVQKSEPSDWEGEVKLEWDAGNVRLYTAASDGVEVASGTSFANAALPTNLWVEGTAASATAGDVILKVTPVGVTCNHADTGCDWARMTMILVDVDVDGLDDPVEEDSPGALVCVTNGPGQTAIRKQITVQQVEPSDWEGDVELLWTAGKVKVYTAPSNGVEVMSGTTFANTALPTNLWVEGIAVSDDTGDVVFRLNPVLVDHPCPNAATGCDRLVMTVIKVDITNVVNTQIVRGHTLMNQVLTGNQASFQASVDVQPAGTQYFLRWHFLSSKSAWTGPFSASTATWNTDVPSNATHTLGELLTVEASFETNGAICDTAVTNMRVFFDIDATTDTHNRPAGSADANWFRHWGVDQDNAVSSYSATGTVVHFGKDVTFSYGGAGGGLTGTYNSNLNNPSIALYDGGHAAENHSWTSAAMTYTSSVGSNVVAAAGTLSIAWTNSGIDLLAIVIAHEAQHLNTDLMWQAPNGVWFLAYGARTADDGDGVLEAGENDFDNDELPNAVEDANPGFRWDVKSTHQPGFYLGGDDEEVWIENAVQATPGGTDANDWAFEGKQSSPSN